MAVAKGGGSSATLMEEVPPRGQRVKGEQVLPFAKPLQRAFDLEAGRHFWDYKVYPRNYIFRKWVPKDVLYSGLFFLMHVGAVAAIPQFSWGAFGWFFGLYVLSGMGITISYHRQLTHKGFKTPKWLEYAMAWCGMQAIQGHPIKWVLWHRQHHACCDTESDVHSPLDGFWWSHMGWMLQGKDEWLPKLKASARDLQSQPIYHHFAKFYHLHAIVFPIACLYALGGIPYVLWGFCARVVFLWHVTAAVNSICHVWGTQEYKTGDLSMNNWLVGLLAFGEGWHNNHHAFETSARHGLKWWQFDISWITIRCMQKVGLAWDVKLPSEAQLKRLALSPA